MKKSKFIFRKFIAYLELLEQEMGLSGNFTKVKIMQRLKKLLENRNVTKVTKVTR